MTKLHGLIIKLPRNRRKQFYSYAADNLEFNVGRYFTNTEFAMLVAKAWVGSDPTQSNILAPMIRETLSAGRAVVYAVKEPR